MTRLRFSIGGLMGIVLVAAIGLAALRTPSETWAGGMLLLTCGTLALAVVGAIARRGAPRMWWLGFGLFGWGYLVLSGCGSEEPFSSPLPTTRLLEILGGRLGIPLRPPWGPSMGCIIDTSLGPSFAQIGHCLFALLAASLGGLLVGFCFGPRGGHPGEARPGADETSRPPRSRWIPPTIAGLVALILLGAIATTGSGAPLWAGLTFSLTAAFDGLAILGAILGRGRRRATWLGAALFGAGYTALIFSRPVGQSPRTHLVTDPILIGLRAPFAPVAKCLFPPDTRILEALDRPISMRFPEETPLEDVLDQLKWATSSPSYAGIPIYVDPIGLQEAERSMNSTVQIDLEGVPLRTTLRLCLKQLGLAYEVEHDYLRITGEAEVLSPDLDDPFLIVGHCLLALLAAGFGAIAAPLVADASREHPDRATSETSCSAEDQAGLPAGVKPEGNDRFQAEPRPASPGPSVTH